MKELPQPKTFLELYRHLYFYQFQELFFLNFVLECGIILADSIGFFGVLESRASPGTTPAVELNIG